MPLTHMNIPTTDDADETLALLKTPELLIALSLLRDRRDHSLNNLFHERVSARHTLADRELIEGFTVLAFCEEWIDRISLELLQRNHQAKSKEPQE